MVDNGRDGMGSASHAVNWTRATGGLQDKLRTQEAQQAVGEDTVVAGTVCRDACTMARMMFPMQKLQKDIRKSFLKYSVHQISLSLQESGTF